MRLWFPISIRRLAIFVGAVLLVIHFATAFLAIADQNGYEWPSQIFTPPTDEWQVEIAKVALWPYGSWSFEVPSGSPWLGWNGRIYETPFDAAAIAVSLWTVLTPLQFFLLRRSMHAAKVRWVHLARVGAYSCAAAPPLLIGYMLVSNPWIWSSQTFIGNSVLETLLVAVRNAAHSVMPLPIWLGILSAAWLFLWWFHATRDYLRLKHSAGVALAMILLSALQSVLFTMIFMDAAFVNLLRTLDR